MNRRPSYTDLRDSLRDPVAGPILRDWLRKRPSRGLRPLDKARDVRSVKRMVAAWCLEHGRITTHQIIALVRNPDSRSKDPDPTYIQRWIKRAVDSGFLVRRGKGRYTLHPNHELHRVHACMR